MMVLGAGFQDSCLLSAHVTQTHGNRKLSQMVCERFVQPYLRCPLRPGAWPVTLRTREQAAVNKETVRLSEQLETPWH